MLKPPPIAAAIVLLLGSAAQAQPGFTTYLIVFMTQTTEPRASGDVPALRKAHDAHLEALKKDGLLLASGPFADAGAMKALLIFSGEPRAVVEQRVADDPLVKAGVLQTALGPWIGPVGIGEEQQKRTAASPGAPAKLRTYQVVLLKAELGQRIEPEDQRGLVMQMDAMAKSGALAAAGPVLEGSDLAWVYVFSATAEDTDALIASNPAVKAGKMSAERHPWSVPEGVLPAGFKVPIGER